MSGNGAGQHFDVLIIGGGVIGLSIARELKKQGVERIAVFERNAVCGAEASSAAAGMLAPQAEADSADDFFNLCAASRDLYPQFAAELLAETGVDIELDRAGTLYLAFYESDLNKIEKRFAWQKAAGLPVVKLTAKEILDLEPNVSPEVLGGLRFELDWQVENRRLVAALNESEQGARLTQCSVDALLFDNKRICGLQTERGSFFAPIVVITAGAWTSLLNFPPELAKKIKISPIRGQILSFTSDEKVFSHVIHTPRGYVVPRRDNRILVGATIENVGFDRRTGSAAMNYLLETKDEISSKSAKTEFVESWMGFRPKTPDGFPLLGEFPAQSGLYFATGHYRNGILLAPLTGKLIADKIANGTDSPYLRIFNPSRF
jgi:glycine oxidase